MEYLNNKHSRASRTSQWFVGEKGFNSEAYGWLKKYGLTQEEIDNNFFWDARGYCVFNGAHYQNARNFTGKGAKYMTKGVIKGNEVVFINNDNAILLSSVVITEDAISSIKVSRVCSAVALHTSVVSMNLILRLSKQFKHLYIWLDKDKAKEVLKEAEKAKPYFDSVKIIWSDLDPKEYSNEEIRERLT